MLIWVLKDDMDRFYGLFYEKGYWVVKRRDRAGIWKENDEIMSLGEFFSLLDREGIEKSEITTENIFK
jgi:hypothetical protein